ncbi:methionyl-tRNA formyltransferase [Anaerococcus sp. AGMB09787]|uniref:methionyl-tRNA formyltransferase n=1 Tax=Anaerococcus sp. AGMB09787 TaxID=2922869 RepID=UPI001FAF4A6E|nr:methionyl-tRNA formyltransferase [Anaerococcus sp. AGMB09787]
MGSPKFALQTLDILYYDKNFDIKLVVSAPDKKRSRGKVTPTPIKEYALGKGLDVITPYSVNTDEFVEELQKREIDFIIVVAFGQLIGKKLLDVYEDRIINLHPSLLPKYRGASPMQFSLLNGEKKTAATAMLIEKGMDSGDILIQSEVPIGDDEDYFDLEERLSQVGAEAIRDALLNFDKVYAERIKQNDEEATYCTKITKEMGKIDWNKSSDEIVNKVRAFVEYPVAFFTYQGKNMKVHKAKVLSGYEANPSYVYKANPKEGLIIGTGNGAIEIKTIQAPGKKAMASETFLLGNKIEEKKKLDE